MFSKNRYAILIEDSKKTFALYGHQINVPTEFLDPVSHEIMEVPIVLAGADNRFDQNVLLQTSGDLNIMEKQLVNPLTQQPATSFQIDTVLQKKIDTFVTGIVILAGEFKAKTLIKNHALSG